jgi:hypothetical protein
MRASMTRALRIVLPLLALAIDVLDPGRLGGRNPGWRDNRPTTGEDEVPASLTKEFDFSQPPIAPLILDPTP